MTRETYLAAAQTAAVAGFASVLLPSIESAWKATPADGFVGQQIDAGTVLYLALALGVGGLYSLASGSALPLVVAATISGLVVVNYRRAYTTRAVEIRPAV